MRRSVVHRFALVLAVIVLVGCSEEAPADEGRLTSTSDFAAVCGGGAVSSAAEYGGSAPHPIAVFAPTPGKDPGPKTSAEDFRDNKFAEIPGWDPDDPTAVQLVACLNRDGERKTSITCALESGQSEVPLYVAQFTATVHEAKTGKEIGETPVEAKTEECPSVALADDDQPKVYSIPTQEEYIDRLGPYVDGKAAANAS